MAYKIRKEGGGRRNRKPIPVPEAIPERGHLEWEIEDSEPGFSRCVVEGETASLSVPLDNDKCDKCGSEHAADTRLHEMTHAAYSPDLSEVRSTFTSSGKKYEVSQEAIQIAEELRVNYKARRLKARNRSKNFIPYNQACPEEVANSALQRIKSHDFREAAAILIAADSGKEAEEAIYAKMRTNASEYESEHPADTIGIQKKQKEIEIVGQLREYTRKIRFFALNNYDANFKSWSRNLHVAYTIDQLLDVMQDAPRQMKRELSQQDDLKEKQDDLSKIEQKLGREQPKTEDKTHSEKDFLRSLSHVDNMKQGLSRKEEYEHQIELLADGRRKQLEKIDARKGEVKWQDYILETPPLKAKLPVFKRNSKPKASDEGSVPMYMHRYALDKAVFKATRRQETGSVLIDVSGSMSLTASQIREIVEAAPASIVALYSGSRVAGNWRGGILRIIAKDGHWLSPEDMNPPNLGMPGGNEIDKPALEWLAKQPLPRIWVSDGQVVSPTHGFSVASWEDCKAVMLKNRINRVEHAKEAKAALEGKFELWR